MAGGPFFHVHFTAEDLLLTRFAARPAPLVELSLSVATLQRRDPLFATWRSRMWRQAARPALQITELIAPNGRAPLFIDPPTDGFEEGLDRVMSTTKPVISSELRGVSPDHIATTPWVRALEESDREAWRHLQGTMRQAHESLLVANWDRLCAGVRGDVGWRSQVIAEQGLKAALAGLVPGSDWQGSTLRVPAIWNRHVYLAGCGLTLYPSPSWNAHVLMGWCPDGSRLLVYPALSSLPLIDEAPADDPIAELLGRTRAAVLALATQPRTTGDLARELKISPASVSAHTKTLRAAGLLTTERAGKAVLHSVTPLGYRLLARRRT
ncbi:ArsR/SmtB family transcription factor [Actinomadura rupiterrae]|uniref:ArsR/SmtB family transcription factor n=1 Tax=Actinomadura rupiterrae TaxID=559627 RepID=UPI0020A5A3F0|nr:helix-turn-helix domain-containing protein [Actinomadura rupiterrae]MCP2338923.1 DNA-binding transcriptional ArsR family regulator [Actinomadura rupiterrae]